MVMIELFSISYVCVRMVLCVAIVACILGAFEVYELQWFHFRTVTWLEVYNAQ